MFGKVEVEGVLEDLGHALGVASPIDAANRACVEVEGGGAAGLDFRGGVDGEDARLRINLAEPRNKMKISLVTMSGGFEMNEEMIQFLENKPELDVQVLTS